MLPGTKRALANRGLLALAVLLLAHPAAALPTVTEGATSAPTTRQTPDGPASVPTTRPTTSAPTTRPTPSAPGPVAADPYAGLDHRGTPSLPGRGPTPRGSLRPDEKRPLPTYDGSPPPRASAGDVLLWIPRALFFPLYVAVEYGLRWPIVAGLTLAEKHHLPQRIKSVFLFADGKVGVFPTAFYDFGLDPSLGLLFFADDIGMHGHDLLLQAGFWKGWVHVVARDAIPLFRDDSGLFTTRVEFTTRPDQVFNGLGPDAGAEERFYRLRIAELELGLRGTLAALNRATLRASYRNVKTTGGKAPSIDAEGSPLDVADPRQVPGFGTVYNLISFAAQLELDTRSADRLFASGSGLRLETFFKVSVDPGDDELLFLRYGGEAAGFWDVSGANHVLAVRVYVELLEQLGDTPVPFPERIALGGAERLRGFLEGHFRGDSALALTLGYRYPVWAFLDANLFLSMGNVFRGRFDEAHLKRMVLSWGFGVRSNTSRDVSFDILVALGSNQLQRWDEEFSIDNVRFVFGVNQGF